MATQELQTGLLPGVGKKLEGLSVFQKDGRLYRFLDAGKNDEFMGKSIRYLEGAVKKPKGFQKVLAYMPKSIQPKLAKLLKGFNKLPFMSQTSHWVKFSLLFEAGTGIFNAVKDGINGFKTTQGGFISKVFGGAKASIKSAIKSTGTFFAAAGAAALVPRLLLGVSALGPVGIITGTIASMFASSGARKLLDGFIKTDSQATGTPSAQNPQMTEVIPQSNNDIANYIDQTWRTRSFLEPFNQGPNPFMSPNMFSRY